MNYKEFYFHYSTHVLKCQTGIKYDYSDAVTTDILDPLTVPYLILDLVNYKTTIDLSFFPTDLNTVVIDDLALNAVKLLDGTYITVDADFNLVYNGIASQVLYFDGFSISMMYAYLKVSRNSPLNANSFLPASDLTQVGNMITALNTGFTALSTSVDTKINALPATVSGLITNSNFQQMDYFDLNGNYGSYPNLSNVLLLPHNHAYAVESSYLFQNDTDQFLVMYILTDALGKKMVAPHNFLQLVVTP